MDLVEARVGRAPSRRVDVSISCQKEVVMGMTFSALMEMCDYLNAEGHQANIYLPCEQYRGKIVGFAVLLGDDNEGVYVLCMLLKGG